MSVESLASDEMMRYHRQISLKSVDIDGQERLKNSNILIVGMGGLGCVASQYLVSGGVGKLTLVDFDSISLTNLQRQILYTDEDIGAFKVEVAKLRLQKLNPWVRINMITEKLNANDWENLVAKHDVILDCTDNLEARTQLNQSCFLHKKPLVSGAAIRFEGQITVFTYQKDEPCYHCLKHYLNDNALSCSEAGVISPIVGVIGSFQALEAMKLIMNIGESLSGKLILIDGLYFAVREMRLIKQSKCQICANAI